MTSLDGIEHHLPSGSPTLTVLIHGVEGSRADWREHGGYSNGGDLTDRLSERGMAWLACDLYGHGDWPAEEEGFSTDHISDELFPPFVARSAEAVRQAIEGPYADVVWLSERFPAGTAQRWDYDAGHALPATWVDDAMASLISDVAV